MLILFFIHSVLPFTIVFIFISQFDTFLSFFCRIFPHSGGVSYSSWFGFAFPLMIVLLLISWAFLVLMFLGPRLAAFFMLLSDRSLIDSKYKAFITKFLFVYPNNAWSSRYRRNYPERLYKALLVYEVLVFIKASLSIKIPSLL